MKFYQGGASIAGAERFVKVVFTIQCTMEKKDILNIGMDDTPPKD
jgi:hypothetical protein